MKKWFKVLAIAIGGLTVTACSSTGVKLSDAKGTLVDFIENSNGHQTEIVYMVHPDMVRVDYGNSGNYTLFNRITQTIYDVHEANKTVTVINKGAEPVSLEPPSGVTITERPSQMVSDGSSTHYRFIKNDKTCLNVVAVSPLFPIVEVAMAEMESVRLNDPRLADIDPESCEYVMRFYALHKAPTLGFPVRMWNGDGYSRFMESYKVQVDLTENNEWYKLPEWY